MDRAIGQHVRQAIISFCLILAALALLAPGISVAEAKNTKEAYCLYSVKQGRILKESNGDERLEPASTTKIVTAICVIENMQLDKVIAIPKSAVGIEGSSIYLKEGEKWQILDLLYGLMFRSGNDAACALAITLDGSVDKFVMRMNSLAEALNCKNTHFDNPHGLTSDTHYTSANDLARLTAYCYKNPIFRMIVGSTRHSYQVGAEARCFVNKNKLLYSYSYANGVKTGYTKSSGRCFVGGAYKDGEQLIAVVLNCNDTYGKVKWLFDREYLDASNE